MRAHRSARPADSGFTMVEMLTVVAIFALVMGVAFSFLINANNLWSRGQVSQDEQRQARIVMDKISAALFDSSPRWTINGSYYDLAISESNQRLDFYKPVAFDADNTPTALSKVTIKPDPDDATVLLMKVGTDAEQEIGHDIESVSFSGSNDGQAFGCTSACQSVLVNLTVVKDRDSEGDPVRSFFLSSQVGVRNTNETLASDAGVTEPEEGEF